MTDQPLSCDAVILDEAPKIDFTLPTVALLRRQLDEATDDLDDARRQVAAAYAFADDLDERGTYPTLMANRLRGALDTAGTRVNLTDAARNYLDTTRSASSDGGSVPHVAQDPEEPNPTQGSDVPMPEYNKSVLMVYPGNDHGSPDQPPVNSPAPVHLNVSDVGEIALKPGAHPQAPCAGAPSCSRCTEREAPAR